MAVKSETHNYTPHAEHLIKHSTYDATKGMRIIPKSGYVGLAEQNGLTAALLESVNTFHGDLMGAAIHVASADLVPRIERAREAGDDTSTLKNTVRIGTHGGSTEIDVRATRTRLNPKTGEPVTKHGVVDVDIDANKRIPHDAADHARHVITKALGLTLETGTPLKVDA